MGNLLNLHDYYVEILGKILPEIEKYTPQLFLDKINKSHLPPYAHSSSVLLTLNEQFFLITAGHAIEDIDPNNIGIMLGNDFVTIGGLALCIEPNNQTKYTPENLDIAIYKLEHQTVRSIKERYIFLETHYFGINRYSSKFLNYLIFGYAEKETAKWFPTKKITPSPFIFATREVSEEYYRQENLDINKNLILFAEQKQVIRSKTNTIEELPELAGISGCGVWHVFNEFGENPQYHLASIITGENNEKSVLYSTKIGVITNLIKAHFKAV